MIFRFHTTFSMEGHGSQSTADLELTWPTKRAALGQHVIEYRKKWSETTLSDTVYPRRDRITLTIYFQP